MRSACFTILLDFNLADFPHQFCHKPQNYLFVQIVRYLVSEVRKFLLVLQADNEVLRSWGTPQVTGRMLSHVDIAHKLGIVDQRAGVDVAGELIHIMADSNLPRKAIEMTLEENKVI